MVNAPAPCRATGGDSSLVSHFPSSFRPTFQAHSDCVAWGKWITFSVSSVSVL